LLIDSRNVEVQVKYNNRFFLPFLNGFFFSEGKLICIVKSFHTLKSLPQIERTKKWKKDSFPLISHLKTVGVCTPTLLEAISKFIIKRMECRKIRKPMMEKKRRARINDSLETLKQILLQNLVALPQGQRPTKLEKADILEMTVRYCDLLHRKLAESSTSECKPMVKEECGPTPSFRFLRNCETSKTTINSRPLFEDKENQLQLKFSQQNRAVLRDTNGRTYQQESAKHWRPW
jgi:Helix-loop-helix DNA-binding domain